MTKEEETTIYDLYSDLYMLKILTNIICPQKFSKKESKKKRKKLHRKEVIQPHVPVQLPGYDLTPVTRHTLNTNSIGATLHLWVHLAPMV